MQGTPAGLPFGMPGIADVIDGAMQQAAQPGRQTDRSMLMGVLWNLLLLYRRAIVAPAASASCLPFTPATEPAQGTESVAGRLRSQRKQGNNGAEDVSGCPFFLFQLLVLARDLIFKIVN